MNPRHSLFRKTLYLVVIVVLLIPLFWLSQPGTAGVQGGGGPGGQLAHLREKHGLSEAQLGEIDPTGQTMKLATLGMRGVATVFLWEKANDYRMRKDWTNLSATLNQLAKLEPHFVSVWRFQGWNLSFNISAEFDNFRDRYRWIIRGIDFLQQGIRYNRHEPRLVWDVGWFLSQKIGRSDETKQFRQLFKADDEFHGSRPLSERDNWLVGKEWFAAAEKLVEGGAVLEGMNPVLFYSKRAMNQMNYAQALEEDGIFEEKTKRAWKLAGEEWREFGDREINMGPGESIRLNDAANLAQIIDQSVRELDALEPGLREKLIQQKREALTAEEREAMELPTEKRSPVQFRTAALATMKLTVTDSELARRVSGKNQTAAQTLLQRIEDSRKKLRSVDKARQLVGYDSWSRLAVVEQEPTTLAARKLVYEGDQFYKDADLGPARKAYDDAWVLWRKLLDKEEFKDLAKDPALGDELIQMLGRYHAILAKRDEPFPKDFPLMDAMEPHLKRIQAEKAAEQKAKKQQK